MTGHAAVLSVEKLVAGYDPAAPILKGVSVVIAPHEIVAILGPNGAGKSTLVKAIAGLVATFSGRILMGGQDITARPTHVLIRSGLAFVPQTENVFATLSVAENLKIAAQMVLRDRRTARISDVYGIFPDLARQRSLLAGRLSGGQRQMLAVARALIVAPKLLVLDEPSAGLSPRVVAEVFHKLGEIRDSGVSILLVEQNVRAALAVSDRLYLLVEGVNHLDGSTRELIADPAIARLFFGGIRPSSTKSTQ